MTIMFLVWSLGLDLPDTFSETASICKLCKVSSCHVILVLFMVDSCRPGAHPKEQIHLNHHYLDSAWIV